jgi:hypothetical protein
MVFLASFPCVMKGAFNQIQPTEIPTLGPEPGQQPF